MSYLVVGDLHLDDKPENEYRWGVFEHIRAAVIQYKPTAVFQLGDAVDRRDRFSAAFVNRLLTELRGIAARVSIVIMRGNHDTTLRPPNFFEFLNRGSGDICYAHEPIAYDNGLLILPFSANPKSEWSKFQLSSYKAIFMHATVTGAVVENGVVMENSHFPILPRRARIYSGDVHVAQTVGNVVYVGAPHPIKFGDRYPCRMLLLNEETFDVEVEIPLRAVRKVMIDIASVEELQYVQATHGDQAKIRFKCPSSRIGDWGAIEAAINQWASMKGITIASTEVVVDGIHTGQAADPEQSPEQILREFAASERLSETLLTVGLTLLNEVR